MLQYKKIILEDGQPCLYLDIDELDIPHIETIKSYQHFTISTYRNIEKSDSLTCEAIFHPVNKFYMAMFDIKEQSIIAQYLLLIHYKIVSNLSDNIQTLENLSDELSNMVLELDKEVNLLDRIELYVKKYIPIKSFEEYGNRIQDSVDKTFKTVEIEKLTGIVILSKMFTPIFGAMYDYTSKKLDSMFKDIYCMLIINSLIESRYHILINKLQNFINNIIRTHLLTVSKSTTADYTNAFNCNTIELTTIYRYATMLIRWFVNIDICMPDTNILTYLTSCTKDSLKTQHATATIQNSVQERSNPSETNSDEGNTSQLECESKRTFKTVDTPILIELGIEEAVKRTIIDFVIDKQEYQDMVDFYRTNPIVITPINSYLLCINFGNMIGGAKGIELLQADKYYKLVALLQLKLRAIQIPRLIETLSLVPSIMPKEKQSVADDMLRITLETSFEYKNCKMAFNYSIGEKTWNGKLNEIVEYIMNKNLIYNTPFTMTSLLSIPNKNGKLFTVYPEFAKDVCEFISKVVLNS